jgi:hypothetical protein
MRRQDTRTGDGARPEVPRNDAGHRPGPEKLPQGGMLVSPTDPGFESYWPFLRYISSIEPSYSDLSSKVMEMKSDTKSNDPRKISVWNGRSQRKCMK